MNIRNYLSGTIGLRLIDVARKTHTCDVLKELKRTEFSSLEELEVIQLDKLRRLLIHCKESVPFYQQLFKECDFDPVKMTSVSEVEQLPVLTKDTIRQNFDQLKAGNFHQYRPRIKETGGSTGQPLRLYHDENSHGTMWANIYRGFGHAGYQPGDKYLTIAGGSLLPKKLKFGRSLYFWLQNSLVVPSYYLEKGYSQELAGLITSKKPKYIYGYSSSIYQFTKYLQESDTRIDCLDAIFTTADMLYPQQRKVIEEVLGAPVFDNYGCPEAGVMTWECEHHDGYHYNMESCFLEILDRDSSGAGRVISTNLANYAFPIVRYDTDDIASLEHTGKCTCGRSHSKIKSLIGRQRDIITLPGGNMLHGAFFNHFPAFYDNDRINRYQIVQTEPEEIEVHIEPVTGCKLEELSYIGDELTKALGNEVRIRLIEGDFRESSISRKHRVVISDVDNIWTRERPN